MVGVTGIEPATSSSRTMRATRLRYTPNGRYSKLPLKTNWVSSRRQEKSYDPHIYRNDMIEIQEQPTMGGKKKYKFIYAKKCEMGNAIIAIGKETHF